VFSDFNNSTRCRRFFFDGHPVETLTEQLPDHLKELATFIVWHLPGNGALFLAYDVNALENVNIFLLSEASN